MVYGRLELLSARRSPACVAVEGAGRSGRTLLAAQTEREARDLAACVAAVLPPPGFSALAV